MLHAAIVAVESLVAFFFLSLGLYVTTRDLPPREEWSAWWKRPGLWGGMAMILASWFFVSVAVQTTIPDKEQYIFWSKWAWWTIPFAAASWYWAVWLFMVDQKKWSRASTFRQATPLFVLMVSALLLSVAGVFTESLFKFSAIEPGWWSFETYYIPLSRPGHHLYTAYLSGGLWICSLLLYYRFRGSRQSTVHIQALKWLYLGTGLVALGTTLATVLYAELRIVPEQLGDTICASGLFLIGVGVVKYNALVKGQVTKEDVKRMGLAVVVVVVVYWAFTVMVFHVLGHASPPAALYLPPLIYFAIFTHAVAGTVTFPRFCGQRVKVDSLSCDSPVQRLQDSDSPMLSGDAGDYRTLR